MFRTDSGAELGSPVLTSQGFLRVDGYVSRPGIYRYPLRPDGTPKPDGTPWLELRPQEEVYRTDSLRSYEGASITDSHPKDREVTAKNVRQHEIGTVMGPGVRADGDRVAAPLLFKDAQSIAKVQGKKKTQLSPGYKMDLEMRPGVDPTYGRYDAVQRNIRVNHLALVDHARGGDSLHIRMDGVDAEVCVGEYQDHEAAPRRGVSDMDQEEQIRSLKTQLAEAERLAETRKDSADEATTRAERAEAKVQPLRDRIVELETTIASGASEIETTAIAKERLRADEAEAAVRQFDDTLTDRVVRRANLMHRASTVMGNSFRMDDLTERQIHETVVKRLDPKSQTRNDSDAFLEGRFETLLELHSKTARSLQRFSTDVVRRDQEDQAEDLRAKRRQEFRDQWKKPLPNDFRAQRQNGGR